MKKIIVSMFIVAGAFFLASPAFADEPPVPVACAVDSDGNTTCEEPVVPKITCSVDEDGNGDCDFVPIEELTPPACTEDDMSACQRGVVMYDKSISQTAVTGVNTHKNETWWDIFTDKKHIAAELGWTVIQDVLILGLLYGFVFKKCIMPKLTKKIHEDIDKEHGIEHK